MLDKEQADGKARMAFDPIFWGGGGRYRWTMKCCLPSEKRGSHHDHQLIEIIAYDPARSGLLPFRRWGFGRAFEKNHGEVRQCYLIIHEWPFPNTLPDRQSATPSFRARLVTGRRLEPSDSTIKPIPVRQENRRTAKPLHKIPAFLVGRAGGELFSFAVRETIA